MSDSPMWKRGKRSRSKRRTRTPCWASSVETVEPAGPPPMTATSIAEGEADMDGLLGWQIWEGEAPAEPRAWEGEAPAEPRARLGRSLALPSGSSQRQPLL